ncbi:MAG TPA: hypothetical protein VGW37_18520 [Terriglobia bacterium]|nr:hypothetical protein [Terriglobia bacterium]
MLSLLTAQSVSAYYNPSTGRFLSRDPVGEPGFQVLQMAQAVPQVGPVPMAEQSSRWINRDSVSEGETENNLLSAIFGKQNLQYIAVLDPEDESLNGLITAQNNLSFIIGNTPYATAENDLINKTDLYGLVCNVVANRTKAIISSGINAGHEWLVYDGKSVGFWPNRGYVVLRPDPAAQAGVPIYWQWDTVQKKSGTIKWGSAAGKSCACATCDDILASIDAAPNPGWHSFPIRNNCRRFVKWVLDGSCLKKGKKTSLNP